METVGERSGEVGIAEALARIDAGLEHVRAAIAEAARETPTGATAREREADRGVG